MVQINNGDGIDIKLATQWKRIATKEPNYMVHIKQSDLLVRKTNVFFFLFFFFCSGMF